jgi:transcriptional regulator with XRE-family HTH domain
MQGQGLSTAQDRTAQRGGVNGDPGIPHQVLLGIELRALRQRRGLSQRRLVRLLGMTAHSNLVDYENGRRLPPRDIVRACEKVLGALPGQLESLHDGALVEIAARRREELLEQARGTQDGRTGEGAAGPTPQQG